MECIYCGSPLEENAEVCASCGKPVKIKTPKAREYKNRKVCAVIGLLFGILGLFSFPLIIFSALAVVFSTLGIRSTKSPLAKTGLILGIIALFAALLMYVIILATNNVTALAEILYKTFLA